MECLILIHHLKLWHTIGSAKVQVVCQPLTSRFSLCRQNTVKLHQTTSHVSRSVGIGTGVGHNFLCHARPLEFLSGVAVIIDIVRCIDISIRITIIDVDSDDAAGTLVILCESDVAIVSYTESIVSLVVAGIGTYQAH